MSIDRLSNMISSIKNIMLVRKDSLEIPYTKQCESVALILKEKGFLANVRVFKPEGTSIKRLYLELAYDGALPRISEIKRVSKPGNRKYIKSEDISPVAAGYGVLVVSTSRGIMVGAEARKKKLGGEMLCKVF